MGAARLERRGQDKLTASISLLVLESIQASISREIPQPCKDSGSMFAQLSTK